MGLKIEDREAHTLVPYEHNAKLHPIKQLQGIVESIQRYGFLVPILIDKRNVIIAGHARYEAATTIGVQTIPCIVADGLTADQVDEFRVLDNLLSESDHDVRVLHGELARLGIDLKPFNIDIKPLDININPIQTDELRINEEKTVVCPECKHRFNPKVK